VSAAERGFTLAEVLVASAVVAVGLVGIAVLVPVTSYAIRDGGQLSASTFLAEARLEQVRGAPWSVQASGEVSDCLGLSASADDAPATTDCAGRAGRHVTFADDAPGTLAPPFESHTRTVRITSCEVPGACPVQSPRLRRVTVTVGYVATSGAGGSTTGAHRPVALTSIVAQGL
jgi:prepilin-type N-terminal cleavage/methylation domain-containing protein